MSIIKKLFILLIIAGLGYVGYFSYEYLMERNRQMNIDDTPTTTAILKDIDEKIVTTGIVEPLVSTSVLSEINGKIKAIKVENGDVVKKGDVLIELDRVTWEAEEFNAKNNTRLQELNLAQNKRDYDRQKELFERGFGIKKEYEDAETLYEKTKIELEVSNSTWLKAKDNLSKTIITAPQDGIITDMELTEGQVIVGAGSVNAGTLLMNVSDLARLYVEAKINEIDVAKVKIERNPRVTFDSITDLVLEGKITEIYPYARQENNLRVFPVKVTFSAGGANIRSGISANIEFPVKEVKNAVSVLLSAIFIEGESSYVYVKRGENEWEKVEVKTGINDISHIEITQGVTEGDEVALTLPKSFGETTRKQKKKKSSK